jgi:hypothetical protein
MAEVISFDSERAARYLNDVFAGYLSDPADTAYQQGFLAACLTLYREALGRGAGDDRLALLDAQTRVGHATR